MSFLCVCVCVCVFVCLGGVSCHFKIHRDAAAEIVRHCKVVYSTLIWFNGCWCSVILVPLRTHCHSTSCAKLWYVCQRSHLGAAGLIRYAHIVEMVLPSVDTFLQLHSLYCHIYQPKAWGIPANQRWGRRTCYFKRVQLLPHGQLNLEHPARPDNFNLFLSWI